jgi:uncharacterized GH25 family protein
MKHKFVSLVLMMVLGISSAFAHALWIQTASVGKVGQKQTIRITYAEPGDKPEKIGDWYSDVKDFELWLTGPDKQRVKLATTGSADFYAAEFTPDKEGVYTLTIGHSAKELGGTTVYQFNSSALVTVGKSTLKNEALINGNELNVFADAGATHKVNQPLNLKGLFKKETIENLHITVFSPSGWSKTIATDKNGVAEFVPLWPGQYFVEASKNWKEEGKHHDKEYKGFWRCATTLLEVTK